MFQQHYYQNFIHKQMCMLQSTNPTHPSEALFIREHSKLSASSFNSQNSKKFTSFSLTSPAAITCKDTSQRKSRSTDLSSAFKHNSLLKNWHTHSQNLLCWNTGSFIVEASLHRKHATAWTSYDSCNAPADNTRYVVFYKRKNSFLINILYLDSSVCQNQVFNNYEMKGGGGDPPPTHTHNSASRWWCRNTNPKPLLRLTAFSLMWIKISTYKLLCTYHIHSTVSQLFPSFHCPKLSVSLEMVSFIDGQYKW